MPDTAPLVTAAEISRLAGVTRATVSNWRRRHPDFPSPAGGSEARPVFVLDEVRGWLREHGVASAESPLRHLRTVLRAQVTPQQVPGLLESLGERDFAAHRDQFGPEFVAALEAAVADAGVAAAAEALAERGLEENPTTGVYVTPEPVADLMAELAGRHLAEVLDPACGSGMLLLAAARRGAKACFGQDIVPVQAQRTALLLRQGDPAPRVEVRAGDSLFADAFPDLAVSAVLSNPPYQQRDWGSDELALDPRWSFGVPPRGESELAWVQHALAHLRSGGVAVLLLPPAVAYRPSGRRIRGELLRRGVLRAVIALPAGAAPPRHLGLHLWVLRAGDSGADSVLFVDASGEPESWPDPARVIAEAWRAFDEGDGDAAAADRAAVVRVMDLLDDEVDLTPGRYVRGTVDAESAVAAADTELSALTAEVEELRAAVAGLPGWSGAGEQNRRIATIADLSKGGAVRVLSLRPQREDSEPVGADDIGRPVLSGRDLATGAAPSNAVDADWTATIELIRPGDVLIPQIRNARGAHPPVRIATEADADTVIGHGIYILRSDPDRIDPWFLAGFAAGPDNAASTLGSTTIRILPSRIRVPLLPLTQQRRYGLAFEHLDRLRRTAQRANDTAARLTEIVSTGISVGALEPAPTPKGRK